MANYLEDEDPTRDDSALRIGEDAKGLKYNEKTGRWEIKDDKSNFDNLDNKAKITNDFTGLQQVSIGGGGPGTKPAALHTEYAGESAGGPAYGTQDLVFYLVRCGSDPDGSGQSLGDDGVSGIANDQNIGDVGFAGEVWDDSSSSMVPIGKNGSTGPNPDNGQLQSGMSQFAMTGYGTGRTKGGPMAPIGGFSVLDSIPLGEFTQNAAKLADIELSLINATRRVEALSNKVVNLSMGGSEKLFSKIVQNCFDPDVNLDAERTSEQILGSLERPPVAELAVMFASLSGGLITGRDIVESVNEGRGGFITRKSRAFQSRFGNPGRVPK